MSITKLRKEEKAKEKWYGFSTNDNIKCVKVCQGKNYFSGLKRMLTLCGHLLDVKVCKPKPIKIEDANKTSFTFTVE